MNEAEWQGLTVRTCDGSAVGVVMGVFEDGPLAGRLRVHGEHATVRHKTGPRDGTAVCYTTHYLHEVEALVDARSRRADSPLQFLTPREREVLGEMAQGRNNASVAEFVWSTVMVQPKQPLQSRRTSLSRMITSRPAGFRLDTRWRTPPCMFWIGH